MKHILTAVAAATLLFCAPAFAQDAGMGAGMTAGAPTLSAPVQSNDNGSRIMAHNQDVAEQNKSSAKSSNTTTAMADKPDLSSQDNLSTTDTLSTNGAGKTGGAAPQ